MISICAELVCSVLQEDAVNGVAVVEPAVVRVDVAAMVLVVVDLVDVIQVVMVTWVGGVVKVETEIVAVETVVVEIRSLGRSLQGTHVSLVSFLEVSMQKEGGRYVDGYGLMSFRYSVGTGSGGVPLTGGTKSGPPPLLGSNSKYYQPPVLPQGTVPHFSTQPPPYNEGYQYQQQQQQPFPMVGNYGLSHVTTKN
jgi:hypothetical protein